MTLMIILISLVFVFSGILCSIIFQYKNRYLLEGLIFGIFTGPIGILIALCLSPVNPEIYFNIRNIRNEDIIKCRYCYGWIEKEASICKHCRSEV